MQPPFMNQQSMASAYCSTHPEEVALPNSLPDRPILYHYPSMSTTNVIVPVGASFLPHLSPTASSAEPLILESSWHGYNNMAVLSENSVDQWCDMQATAIITNTVPSLPPVHSDVSISTSAPPDSLPFHTGTDNQQVQNMAHAAQRKSGRTSLRQQLHTEAEQKRRIQINDGFEDLRLELPLCLNKKLSKVALLRRSIQHLRHLEQMQTTIKIRIEQLENENKTLKSFHDQFEQYPSTANMP